MPIDFRGIPTRIGTLAQRPAASTVGEGSLYIATDTAQIFRSDEVTWTEVFTSAAAGQLLKAVSYSTLGGVSYTIAGTPTDLDATHLSATFTVPASGNVIAVLSGLVFPVITGNVNWCLRSGSSIVPGSDVQIVRVQEGGSVPFDYRATYRELLTGLTPGSVTWKWAAYGAGTMLAGGAADGAGNNGQFVMEFYSA